MTLAIQAASAAKRACDVIALRLAALELRLGAGDDTAWSEYLAAATVLAALLPNLTPGSRGELLTTKQMAERLSISPKTLLKGKANGAIKPALQLGSRGRAAIRWRAE